MLTNHSLFPERWLKNAQGNSHQIIITGSQGDCRSKNVVIFNYQIRQHTF